MMVTPMQMMMMRWSVQFCFVRVDYRNIIARMKVFSSM
jgi:hypothetical protein